ncbi:glycosyltransferase [Nocardioides pelophilus]
MPAVVQRIVDACADLPARVIVTTGPVVDPDGLRLPTNAEAHRWLPHAEVMPRVSMVVGHGGHSTTMLALAHDLPVLVIPMFLLVDQPMVGKALESAGAGRRLPKRAPARAIRPVVEELLGAGAHRDAAAGLGAEIRDASGAETAAARIAALVSEGAVDRPEG